MRFTGPLPAVTDLRSYTVESQSLSLSYAIGASSSDTIQITIPAIANGFLDPATLYLHCTFSNTSTDSTGKTVACRFSGSAQSLIQRHDLYSGQSSSALLQTLDNYNVLAQALLDFEEPTFVQGQFAAIGGVSGDDAFSSYGAQVYNQTMEAGRYGRVLGNYTASQNTQPGYNYAVETMVGNNAVNLAIPVLSPLGLLGTKAVPLAVGFTNFFYLATGTLALILPMAGPLSALTGPGTPQGTLTNVRLVYRVIETPPQLTMALFASAGGGPLQIPVTNWVSATGVHPANQSTNSILLGVAAASAKSILFSFRNSAMLSNVQADSIAGRINPSLDQWWLQIGSSVMPVNKVRTDAQSYATLLQSRHMLNTRNPISISNGSYAITSNCTYIAANTFLTTNVPSCTPGSCLFGLDLDQVTGKSDSVISGLNLNGQIVTVNLTWASNVPGYPLQFNAHIERNALISFQPGAGFQVAY
jgi:hypothetical protein